MAPSPAHPASPAACAGLAALACAEPLQAIAGFAALLREHGLPVGVAEQHDFVCAALALPLRRGAATGTGDAPTGISAAWRAIACHDRRAWRQWPELFERYWHPQRLKGSVRVSGQTRPTRDIRQVVQQLQQSLAGDSPPRPGAMALDTALNHAESAAGGEADTEAAPRAHGGASRTEALHDRSLASWLPQDLTQLQLLAERIARRLRVRLTRRWRDHPRGARLDLRRTLRASLKTGGVPVQPAWRRPRREKPRVFILVDVSRSMETHAQLFLRIARAFVVAVDARVFVFHTRLAEVTPLLQRDSATVQEKINAVTAGFGGGTRIATSLADFHGVHARAQLGRAARVWVLSDGFDADEPQRLAEELAAVRARGARISWFHPSEQPPASQAMQAAAPLVGRFVRLNSLRDLAAAAEVLN